VSAREQILAWLRRAEGPLSGAELAARLGCTRAAVWKHVAALRRAGHEIDGRRANGYVLAHMADTLDAASITQRLRGRWRQVEWHDALDSTQHRARALANAGAPEGTAVFADRQLAGRGRLGRTWFSPVGANLHLTVVLRPACAPSAVAPLSLVAGLAVVDAVRAATGIELGLKWPNDVQLDGRKIAGILTEMQGETDRVDAALVGIGLNVNLPASALPAELAATATSLRIALGHTIDRADLAARLLAAIEARYGRFLSEGFRGMRSEFEAASVLRGRTVEVSGPATAVSGRVRGVDDEGALLLAGADGRTRRVIAGEVTLQRGVGR
jgi:BirA family biotin operon repressor/biotin-[acetyl-CoA-carboxylase] ligase